MPEKIIPVYETIYRSKGRGDLTVDNAHIKLRGYRKITEDKDKPRGLYYSDAHYLI